MDVDIAQLTTAKSPAQLDRIGAGCCGSVWSDAGTAAHLAMKREDGGPGRSLVNEYHIHKRVLQAAQAHPHLAQAFSIPLCYAFLGKHHTSWPLIIPRLPEGCTACNALISEKIQPVPHVTRQLLVRRHVPEAHQGGVLEDGKNTHCLIRTYLGRRKHRHHPRPGKSVFFSLRNFPLHVDQMEDLGLDLKILEGYATAMADALAFLHWCARVDANDVEFVLAQPRQPAETSPTTTEFGTSWSITDPHGSHALWVLDFDCCKEMTMDEDGIDRAARCFWRNDPYFPRPGGTELADQRLWDVFRTRFLEASASIITTDADPSLQRLPVLLITAIMETKRV